MSREGKLDGQFQLTMVDSFAINRCFYLSARVFVGLYDCAGLGFRKLDNMNFSLKQSKAQRVVSIAFGKGRSASAGTSLNDAVCSACLQFLQSIQLH